MMSDAQFGAVMGVLGAATFLVLVLGTADISRTGPTRERNAVCSSYAEAVGPERVVYEHPYCADAVKESR